MTNQDRQAKLINSVELLPADDDGDPWVRIEGDVYITPADRHEIAIEAVRQWVADGKPKLPRTWDWSERC